MNHLTDLVMDLGPHASFIIASYAAAALVVLALIAWVVADRRRLQATLDTLEAEGVVRRSSGGTDRP